MHFVPGFCILGKFLDHFLIFQIIINLKMGGLQHFKFLIVVTYPVLTEILGINGGGRNNEQEQNRDQFSKESIAFIHSAYISRVIV
ncbi:hypothetical protein D3C87_1653420 [compost metagenome]